MRSSGNLFTYLPIEIIIDILSRLPVRAVIGCKCVCKSWLGVVESDEFVKSHLSKAIPSLIYRPRTKLSDLFEYELEDEQASLHFKLVTKFDLPIKGWMGSSINGLLLLSDIWNSKGYYSGYVCNPVTREYIELPSCPNYESPGPPPLISWGLGVGKISGQYKVILIFSYFKFICTLFCIASHLEPRCHVYTIGKKGSWRRVEPIVPRLYPRHCDGAFVNGNLHWLALGLTNSRLLISCFDLETEVYSTVSPPFEVSKDQDHYVRAIALGECLCLSEYTMYEIVIWSMKEYGVETSWRKEFVINLSSNRRTHILSPVYPIRVFKNGDFLMACLGHYLFYYYKENNTTQNIDIFESDIGFDAILHRSSLISLKTTFQGEDVKSF